MSTRFWYWWMAILMLLTLGSARICEDIDLRNSVEQFEEQLRGCTVVVGFLKIVLFEHTTVADFRNLTFPELIEIKGFLLLYRVYGLTTLGRLFPNLTLIRGFTLIKDYALVFYDMPHLSEIGLHNLTYIARGSTRIEKCPQLCYVSTIDWEKIGSQTHALDYIQTNNPPSCGGCAENCNDYCWNRHNCQIMEPKKCHPDCLICKGPISDICDACKYYSDMGRCVRDCPKNKFRHRLLSICVTDLECYSLMNGSWWIFQGECTQSCPTGYQPVSKEEGWCVACGDRCNKECNGLTIDSIASAQSLKGCTHINGSLSIRINSKSMMEEMEENLGMIEEIGGFLKIHRSHPLKTLKFLKNLKIIHGKDLENKRHALIVFENQNLHKLWEWTNFNLEIRNGTLSFHYNPMLCFSEIHRLTERTKLAQNYTSIDVSEYSNGDKTACNWIDLNTTITEVSSTNVTIRWNKFESNNSTLIGFFLYYIEDTFSNTSIYDGRDACDINGWNAIFTANNQQQITSLRAFTQYAFYLKTYTSSPTIGAQTKIHRFRTSSDDPSQPLSVEGIALSYDSIKLTWKPPQNPNGILSYYHIVAYLQLDNPDFIYQRNYCRHPTVYLPIKETETTTVSVWTNTTTTDCCKTSSQGRTTETFDTLCDNSKIFIGSAKACKDYKYVVDSPVNIEGNVEFFPMDKRKYTSPKKMYASKSDPIEIKTEHANMTSYIVKNLTHFSIYVFLLKACIDETKCSSPVMEFSRTKRKPRADDIPSGIMINVKDNDVYIEWYEPKYPNSLIVSYEIEYRRSDLEHSKSVSECITQAEFRRSRGVYRIRNFPDGDYELRVKSSSLAGPGYFSDYVAFRIYSPRTDWILIVVLILIPLLLLLVLLSYYFYRKRQKKTDHMRLIASINPDYSGTVYIEDEWELDRSDVQMSKELGQGTFGMVYSGLIKSQNRPCAVKTVNEHSNVYERMEFLNEASVMKAFSDAHHVVKLLGVVSKGQPPLVVMELMARGDLKSFLRQSRDASNMITCAEMYRMASEIADGMAYLTAKKFVHRDLAARNCMVSADYTVKIGDFGMTRDIYETDYYRKESRGLMPVRWMAPESLADGVFTSDSDVWSYGVVLWEMATLAEQPYQGLANEQVLQFVIAQGTLERPSDCPDLLCEIMEACWKWRPSHRPLFIDIVDKLEKHVGQDFRLVSFYHSREGEEYRMNAKERVYNPPALTVGLEKNTGVHWNASDDDVSLYSLESNRPTPLLSSIQNQRQTMPSSSSYH